MVFLNTMSNVITELNDDEKNSWRTDFRVFHALDKEFNFSMDAAASDKNNLCDIYLDLIDNALSVDWSLALTERKNKNVFVNPPYGRGKIKPFMAKCIEEKEKGVTSVMLVPGTLDANWLPVSHVSEIRIITGGRLTFLHPIKNEMMKGNPKGSMIVIFRPSINPLVIRLIDRDELISFGSCN